MPHLSVYLHGSKGYYHRVCRLSFLPLRLVLLDRLFLSVFHPSISTFKSMSSYNYAPGAVHLDVHNNNISITGTEVFSLVRSLMENNAPSVKVQPSDNVEDVSPIDTSFFTSYPFSPEMIEKNLRQAINLASSKADACRRIMALENQGYIILSNLTDERKAELINPFSLPKFSLKANDFKKARNNPYRKKTS